MGTADFWVITSLAWLYFAAGLPYNAEAELLAAEQLNPDDARVWATRGDLYARWAQADAAQSARAESAYRRAMALAPNVATYHAALGSVLAQQGRHEEAVAELRRAVPALMKAGDPRAALVAIIDEMEQGEEPLEKTAEARLITSVCQSIAVKGGQVLSLEEMRELVRRLEHTTAPRTCPHGRPTVIQLNLAQLAREFGRK